MQPSLLCILYRHGSIIKRFNDDGEPGGTAGMPPLSDRTTGDSKRISSCH